MTSDQNIRWTGFIAASFLLHAAALAFLDFNGADYGQPPSRLTVLLESRRDAEVTEVTEPPASASRSRDLFLRPSLHLAKRAPAKPAENKPAPAAPDSQATRAAVTIAEHHEPSLDDNTAVEASPPEDPQPEEIETGSALEAVAASEPAPSEEFFRQPTHLAATGVAAVAAAPAVASERSDSTNAERRGQLLSLLHEAISREKRYPLLAVRQRREGTATVSFSLSPSGEMDAVGIDQSSGFSVLDTAAVSAVSRVAPFAPARIFLSDVTRFKVDVTFQLN